MYPNISIYTKTPLDKNFRSINNVYMSKNIYNILDYQAKFETFLLSEKYAFSTVKSYLSDLEHYLSWAVKSSIMPKIDRLTETEFQASASNEALEQYETDCLLGLPMNTAKRRIAAIRRFQNFLVSEFDFVTNGKVRADQKSNPLPLSNLLNRFKLFLINKGNSNRTVKNYVADVSEYLQITNLNT